MDKNLNSMPRVPWWVVVIQISPLILQLVSEVVSRIQGGPSFPDGTFNSPARTFEPENPAPHNIKSE